MNVRFGARVTWVDECCLYRHPDEGPVAVAGQHEAAHEAAAGAREPLLRGGDCRGVHEGEAEAVQREGDDGQGEVGLDGEEGEHEAQAGETSTLDILPCKISTQRSTHGILNKTKIKIDI